MASLQDIREKYPQYDHVSDEDLVNALHQKYYSHVPKDEFYSKIGYQSEDTRPIYKRLGTDILAGLAKQGHRVINTPHDIVAGFEEGFKPFQDLRRNLPGSDLIDQPDFGKISEAIPYQPEYDYAKMLGQRGEGSLADKIIQGGLEYMPEVVVGGKLAASLGSKGFNLAAKTIKDNPITSSGIAKKALEHKTSAKQAYEVKYNNIFEKAAEQGIKETAPFKQNIDRIVSNSLPKYHEALLQYKAKPTLKNAHDAQSDLGKLIRSLDKSNAINPLTSAQIKTYKEAKKAQDTIKQSMFKKSPELAQEYAETTKGYANDVIPYSTNKALRMYGEGKLSAKKTVQRLKNNDEFMLQMGQRYPGMKVNQFINSPLGKKLIGGLLTGGGIKVGWDIIG